MSNTTQQINTLLAQLTHHAFKQPILFAKPLSQVVFDYTPDSINRLNQLLTHIAKKNYPFNELIKQEGGTNFFLTIAAYLANYLAKTTDEPIVWLSYSEALTEINKKNREYGTDFTLEKDFDNSLVAKIGDGMFCRPLQAVRATLMGEGDITSFIEEMQTSIFDRAFVDVADSPDTACQRYLAKIRDGKVKDTTIAFFDDIKGIEFDFSDTSLLAIDRALETIRQKHGLSETNYLEHIQDPAIQALCYLLGFYLGVTTGKLSQRPTHWASFSQAQAMLHSPINYSLEHSFVMLSENHYHTPMLAITNTLFAFTDFPRPSEFVQKFIQDTQDEFAHPTAETLQWFSPHPATEEKSSTLPNSWQMAMSLAGRLLTHDLLVIFDGGELSPNFYEVNVETKKAHVRTLDTTSLKSPEKAIASLYENLKSNPNNLPLLVASYDSELNLTTGKTPAIVLEIRVYQEPKLALQLMLPYRSASDPAGFAIFDIAYHTQNALAKRQPQAHKILTARLPQLVDMLYFATQKVPSPMHTGSFWDNYYVPAMSSMPSQNDKMVVANSIVHNHQKSPLVLANEEMPAEQITLNLFQPIVTQHEPIQVSQPNEGQSHSALENVVNPNIEQTAEMHTINVQTAVLSNSALSNNALQNNISQTTSAQNQDLADTFAPQPAFQDHFSPRQEVKTSVSQAAVVNENAASAITSQPMADIKTDAKTKAELLDKLRQDQARLKNELSTSDESKDKKLMYIGIAVVVVILVMIVMSKLLK